MNPCTDEQCPQLTINKPRTLTAKIARGLLSFLKKQQTYINIFIDLKDQYLLPRGISEYL